MDAGGVVICAGKEYSGAFSGCTFRSTAVYAVHGAAITLRSCAFIQCNPGITVSGTAAAAALHTCTLSNCSLGVIVERGGTLTAQSSRIDRAKGAVVVNGCHSRATLHCCVVDGGHSAADSHVAMAVRGGSLSLRSCTVREYTFAVFGAMRPALIEAHALCVSDCVQGFSLTSHARATVRGCEFDLLEEGADTPISLAAWLGPALGFPGHACMQLERSAVHGGATTGAITLRGARLAAHLCRFACSRDVVSTGDDGGRAVVTRCSGASLKPCFWSSSSTAHIRVNGGSFVSDETVCVAKLGATVVVVDCELRGRCVAVMTGVVSVTEASAWLHKCRIHDGVAGVHATLSNVRASDTDVADMHALVPEVDPITGCSLGISTGGGGFVCLGGEVHIRGGSVRRCKIGVVAEATGVGVVGVPLIPGAVSVKETEFADCARGMQVSFGSQVDVTSCVFRGPDWERGRWQRRDIGNPGQVDDRPLGIAYSEGAGGSVQGCTFEGFFHDVGVSGPGCPGVSIRRCTFLGTTDGGTSVLAKAATTIEDCTFSGACGVNASQGAVCSVRGCEFTEMTGEAVAAATGAAVTVSENTLFEDCMVGMVCRGPAKLAAQDCTMSEVVIGICMADGGGTLSVRRVTVDSTHFCVCCTARSGADSTVKLVDSSFSGEDAAVVLGDIAVRAMVLRCKVSNAHTGVIAAGRVAVKVRGCTITKCDRGVLVGDTKEDVMDECVVCGASGRRALVAAWQALLDVQAGRRQAGRCSHEGAVARMTLADGTVSDCGDVGVVVHPSGHLAASTVTVRACTVGIWVESLAERSTFSECEVVGCITGVLGQRRASTDEAVPVEREEVVGVHVR